MATRNLHRWSFFSKIMWQKEAQSLLSLFCYVTLCVSFCKKMFKLLQEGYVAVWKKSLVVDTFGLLVVVVLVALTFCLLPPGGLYSGSPDSHTAGPRLYRRCVEPVAGVLGIIWQLSVFFFYLYIWSVAAGDLKSWPTDLSEPTLFKKK